MLISRGGQILVTWVITIFLPHYLIFVGSQYGTCYMSSFWHLEFLGEQ